MVTLRYGAQPKLSTIVAIHRPIFFWTLDCMDVSAHALQHYGNLESVYYIFNNLLKALPC